MMRRELSVILVSFILLLSPLSCSTEKIPDFTPEYSVTSVYAANTAVAPRDGTARERIHPPQPEKQAYTLVPTIITAGEWSKTALFGRAPPA